jgi:hypothetical protein
VAASRLNSSEFRNLARFMILAEVDGNRARIPASNGPAVAHVYNINVVVEGHHKIGTASALAIVYFLRLLKFFIHHTDVFVICQMRSFDDCGIDVMRKIWLHYNLVVQVLLEIFGALVAAMAVIYCENLNFWPFGFTNFGFFQNGLNDVENDGYSVLVGLSDQADVGVGREGSDHAKSF